MHGDHQFELFVAAIFRRAGYEIALDEPDVVIRTHQALVGIAAKRPHAWANFDDLIEEADRQIRGTGRIGIIALDVSYITNPTDASAPGMSDNAGLADVRAVVDGFLHEQHARMLQRVNRETTIGVIVYACTLAVDIAAPRFAVARGCVFGNFCSLKDPNLALFTTIRERLTCAI